MSRDRILADVRAALRQRMPEGHHYPGPRIAPAPAHEGSLAERFHDRFTALGGQWAEVPASELSNAVLEAARDAGGDMLLGSDPGGPLAGLDKAVLTRAGIRVDEAGDRPADPDRFGISVTGVACAIADSGTFGILTGPGQGRLTSVIAPVHLAVLAPDRIVPSLADFLAMAEAALRSGSSSAAILITGPSRTADIEGQLIVGVHGPRQIRGLLVTGA